MTDPRLQQMAQVLVHYSLGLKQRERLAIQADAQAAPLVKTVVREALHAGAYPGTFVMLPGVHEIIRYGSSGLRSKHPGDGRDESIRSSLGYGV